jgi:hypothetical protein
VSTGLEVAINLFSFFEWLIILGQFRRYYWKEVEVCFMRNSILSGSRIMGLFYCNVHGKKFYEWGETMKETHILLLIVGLLLLSSCGHISSTTSASMLVVTEKGHTSDKEYWIKAYDPNNQTKEEAFKLVIDEEILWENIEVDEEYASTYVKKGDQPWILIEIN